MAIGEVGRELALSLFRRSQLGWTDHRAETGLSPDFDGLIQRD